MNSRALQAYDLNVAYGKNTIIRSARFELPSGIVAGLVGPNGSGKSTLLRAIAGLQPCSGEVVLGDAKGKSLDASYLPQSNGVRSGLTVLEVLLLGRREHLGWSVAASDIAIAGDVLTRFRIRDLAHRPMDTLSGGQQQIVLIAQRLVRAPEVLLLDEPTSALDLHHQLSVMEILRSYVSESGALVLAAIHDLALASSQCDYVMMLDRGTICASGEPATVLTADRISAVYRVSTEPFSNAAGMTLHIPVSAIEMRRPEIPNTGP